MNNQSKRSIILLKSKSSSEKEYDTLKKKQDEIYYVPVMSYESVNLDDLHKHLNNKLSDIAGIIITSQRAVYCLLELLNKLRDEYVDNNNENRKVNQKSSVVKSLLEKPVFAVGPTTSRLLAKYGFLNIRGAVCTCSESNSNVGNADDLVECIIADHDAQIAKFSNYDEHNVENNKHLLFLTGEVRKNTIPEVLRKYKFSLVEKVIYRTKAVDATETLHKINGIIENTSHSCDKGESSYCNWVVFYSSQGVSSIVEQLLLKRSDTSRNCEKGIQNNKTIVKVASIGPSTGQYLMDQGIIPEVVASRPTAAQLFKEIEQYHNNENQVVSNK